MNKREFLKNSLLGTGCMFLTGKQLLGHETSPLTIESRKDHIREAMFYSPTPKGVRCLICPNGCNLREGESGECRSRKNIDGKLYTIGYGNPCALHIDPVEKKPLLHFYPGSKAFSLAVAGCNLSCLNCQNWTISQKGPDDTQNYELFPDKLIENCLENKCKSIAYTYSEPITFYEYTYDSSVLAKQAGIKNILVSAGYINKEPLLKLCKVIDAANIDLKSFSNEIYMKLNGGTLQPVLDTLKTMKDEGVWLEITNLVVPSWTDDLEMIKRMCDWLIKNGFETTPLHFSRFNPMYKLAQLPPTPVNILTSARDTAKSMGLKHVYIGNVAGFDSENTICPKCKKVIIERRGFSILKNEIKNGKCMYCGSEINGIWE